MHMEILQPVVAMLLLTAVVWMVLFVRRLSYMAGEKIDAEQMQTPQQTLSLLPDDINAPANNFKNLFEVPVLFYVVCLCAAMLNSVDAMMLNCAWGFVLLRVIHSVIHCTYNRVMHRFMAYMGSCLLLGVMLFKLALATF
ncbi:MAG: MAPEG family protein [Pseudomonadota bacterium]|nr:MAPEG family protein [Pseudomonadota bacterium]